MCLAHLTYLSDLSDLYRYLYINVYIYSLSSLLNLSKLSYPSTRLSLPNLSKSIESACLFFFDLLLHAIIFYAILFCSVLFFPDSILV